jgi:hypothetical protein
MLLGGFTVAALINKFRLQKKRLVLALTKKGKGSTLTNSGYTGRFNRLTNFSTDS